MKKRNLLLSLSLSLLLLAGCGGSGTSSGTTASNGSVSRDEYAEYVDENPDLAAAYASYVASGGSASKEDWGYEHYTTIGKAEGRELSDDDDHDDSDEDGHDGSDDGECDDDVNPSCDDDDDDDHSDDDDDD